MTRALQKQALKDYWLSEGITSWLTKLLTPYVAAVLNPSGVTIPKVEAVSNLDSGLFKAIQLREPVDDRVAWRALHQAGYLTLRKMTSIGREVAMVLALPNEDVSHRLWVGFLKRWFPYMFPALCELRNRLAQVDLIGALRAVEALSAKGTVFSHYRGCVSEPQVQGLLYVSMHAVGAKFVTEGPTRSWQFDFVVDGSQFTHLIELKMFDCEDEAMVVKLALSSKVHNQVKRYFSEPRVDGGLPLKAYCTVSSKKNGRLLTVESVRTG